MNYNTEILIVGAGPAGCVASLSAKKHKLNSILVERKRFPRDKICGDGIFLAEVHNVLSKIDIDFNEFLKANGIQLNSFFSFYNSNTNKFQYKKEFTVVKRVVFDDWLWSLNDNKSIDNLKFEDVKIIDIKKENIGYTTYCTINNKESIINSKYIIAADGYSSYIKRNFFTNIPHECRVASRYYLTTNIVVNDSAALYFDDEVIPGYFWVFKIDDNNYNTGVYMEESSHKSIFELHSHFIQKYFNENIQMDKFSTWSIPNNVKLSDLSRNNIFLTGDAAGLCDKMFGHGIDNAIISGFVAVESIFEKSTLNINYNLEEIYRYKLSQYIESALLDSQQMYNRLKKEKKTFYSMLKNILKAN